MRKRPQPGLLRDSAVPVTNSLAWLSELLGKAALLKPSFSLTAAIVRMRKEGRGARACSLFFLSVY